MKTKHTPTPWTLDSRWPKCVVSEYALPGPLSLRVVAMNLSNEDAAYIVKCVNVHEELVISLKRIQKALKQESGHEAKGTFEMCEVIQNTVNNALAKAEGK